MKPKGYWIVRLDVHDDGRFAEYAAVVRRIMAENGARFLVRGGRSEVMAGPTHSRVTVIEFPDYDTAVRCSRLPEYLAAKQRRDEERKAAGMSGAATGDAVIVEGYESS